MLRGVARRPSVTDRDDAHVLETAVANRARSLTRPNYAEFRDDAFVEVAGLKEAPSPLRHPEAPCFLQRGEGSCV